MSLPHCSKVRWQPGRLGGKSRLQILGENLGLVKTMGGLSVGVLFSRTAEDSALLVLRELEEKLPAVSH